MKQIAINNNPSFQFGKVMLTSWAIATGFVGGGALIGTKLTHSQTEAPVYTFGNTQSDYGVMAVQITSESTGKAVVNLDGFRVYTSFDFDSFEDSNGQLGGEFTAIEITNLSVDKVLNMYGDDYGDFTNKNDIRNMISIITAHIVKNKMVEEV
ncbi:hypothetical protein [Acinetobacter colistiniresistens]|uniref:Uncharacterized protein n=1 Tax=Acinetobacter colistiniresistens TaxID=280145 RepID=A0A558FB50_9GAMM|nr:hypothetical protein [Acinetobacter colistiniresistens]TVT82735.1 hypothetical protein FPV60_08755 [Acinetobacter colistiniresistens]